VVQTREEKRREERRGEQANVDLFVIDMKGLIGAIVIESWSHE